MSVLNVNRPMEMGMRKISASERKRREASIDRATAWREDAMADGWSCEATYGHEPVESAFTMQREGFVAMGLARQETKTMLAGGKINLWGPDGLAIEPPETYDWEAITSGLRTCANCGATDVDTQRYSFAGRCCAKCRPEMAKTHESGNWTA